MHAPHISAAGPGTTDTISRRELRAQNKAAEEDELEFNGGSGANAAGAPPALIRVRRRYSLHYKDRDDFAKGYAPVPIQALFEGYFFTKVRST